MSALDRLDKIEARANAATRGVWVDISNDAGAYIVGACPEAGCCEYPMDHPDVLRTDGGEVLIDLSSEDAEFIAHAREDVPALVAALRAVLAVLDGAAQEYRATSDAMIAAAINREADAHDGDTITRYAAYAGAAEGAARRAREAVDTALGGA